jgi:sirohydrochlorin ferrochelatase
LREQGHRQAIVVPLLFTPAFHARTDAPAAVRMAEDASGVSFTVAEILGTGDDLLPILDRSLAAAGIGAGELLITSVGSSRPQANAMVVELANRIAVRRGAAVHTAFATCDPRAGDVLAEHPSIAGVLALFVGHGLLLDKINSAAAARGIPVAAPLEAALAPIVEARYQEARQRIRPAS